MTASGEKPGRASGRWQGLLIFFLCLALAAFLTAHSLFVYLEAEACFDAMSLHDSHSYLRVADMPFGQLARSVGRIISTGDLIIAGLGFLPLLPFLVAWMVSPDRGSRRLWLVSAIVTFIAITGWTVSLGLAEFYECDRNGVSLGIVALPILYTAATLAATLLLALLRSVVTLLSE